VAHLTRGRRTFHTVIALLLLGVPVAFLSANLKNPTKVNAFDRVILGISSPIQRGVGWVVDGLGDAWHDYVWLVDVQKENDELVRENAALRAALADANARAKDSAALAGLLELRARVAAPTRAARVIAVGASPYFRVNRLVLDRGEGEVTPGMAVIAPSGVVGRIQRVYGSYADVVLAVDPQSSIDVVVPRAGSRGVMKGLGGDNDYACKIEYLLRSEEIREGDVVVTSGLGGVFPKDLPVGTIRKIEKKEYGMYQEVEVAPSVDFSHLGAVLVILSPPPPPDPTANQKKKAEPAFGLGPSR
jgi:rod shape-determining protein MreC